MEIFCHHSIVTNSFFLFIFLWKVLLHKFPHGVLYCFLITSLGTLSPIILAVVFRFVFFSVPYLSFCLWLWNIAFEIIDPVLFLFNLLCLQFFCCFRLRNFACEILGLVVFLFHLLCAISLCCFRKRNLACETLSLVLFLFHLLCSQFFSCLRLWNFSCETLGLVLFLFHLLCAISLCCFRLRKLAC